MRSTILVLLFLANFTIALSHPGVGIVMDRRGNVYYTDLKHVWKIAPDGRKSIAARNVHTHELVLDGEDNLCGEHLRYAGEATNRWWHRIWKLSPDGTVTDLIPERQGFLNSRLPMPSVFGASTGRDKAQCMSKARFVCKLSSACCYLYLFPFSLDYRPRSP